MSYFIIKPQHIKTRQSYIAFVKVSNTFRFSTAARWEIFGYRHKKTAFFLRFHKRLSVRRFLKHVFLFVGFLGKYNKAVGDFLSKKSGKNEKKLKIAQRYFQMQGTCRLTQGICQKIQSTYFPAQATCKPTDGKCRPKSKTH